MPDPDITVHFAHNIYRPKKDKKKKGEATDPEVSGLLDRLKKTTLSA